MELDNEEYGEDRLEALIQTTKTTPIGNYIDKILESQRNFMGSMPVQDDISIIAIHRTVVG